MSDVGLDYLELGRAATLYLVARHSAFAWRRRLAADYRGYWYVLDEPSIGLHQRDNYRLIATLKHLRNWGIQF